MPKKIKVGDRVKTSKGSRYTGPSRGTVVKVGLSWKSYEAVSVRKSDGTTRLFLAQNLTVVGGSAKKTKTTSTKRTTKRRK
jgi:hypothetical protein